MSEQDNELDKALEVSTTPIQPSDIALPNITPLAPPPSTDKLNKLIDKFALVADTIITRFDEDRSQIDDFIKQFALLIQGDPEPNRGLIDSITNLIRTKADNNTNAVSLLDAMSKLLAASKNNQLFVQNNTVNSNDLNDLQKLLNEDN